MRIKGFDKLTDLRTFMLTKREGAHTSCDFTFRASTAELLPLLALEGGAVTVQRDDGSTLFYGVICSVSVEQSHHGAILSVKAASYSVLTDEEPHTRIFQKPMQNLQDILSQLEWSKAKCELNMGEAGNKKPAGLIVADKETNAVIQNEETDFALLHRLVLMQGWRLWIIDSNSGRTELRAAKHLAQRQVFAKDIISLTRCRQQGQTKLNMRGHAETELDTGQQVKIEGIPGNYIVIAKNVQKEREAFFFDYELAEENSRLPVMDGQTRARIFTAEVTDNNDPDHFGRVQVKYTDKKVEDRGIFPDVLWLPYRSSYAGKEGQGGIVFLPDKGDQVEVLLLGRKLWAAASFRRNNLLKECSKVEEKYIGNNTQQRVFWKEKSLELASFKNSVVLDEEKIELSIGDSNTKIILDKEKILLHTEGNDIELSPQGIKLKMQRELAIDAATNIHLKAGQNLREESGSESSIRAKGSMALKAGGKITVDGSAVNIC